MKPSQLALILIVLGVMLTALFFGGGISWFMTDWMWFEQIGLEQVFWGRIWIRFTVGMALGGVAMAIVSGNAVWALRHTQGRRLVLPPEIANSPLGTLISRLSLAKVAVVVCLLLWLAFGWSSSVWWQDFMLFFYGGDFGYVDPILGHDASFYVFTLPVLGYLRSLVWGVTLLTTLVCGAIYGLRGAIKFTMVQIEGNYVPKAVEVAEPARRHLAALAGFLVLLIGVGFFLRRYDLLSVQRELFDGPRYSDDFGTLPLLGIEAGASVIAAGLLYIGLVRRRNRLLIAAGALVLASVGLTAIYPGLVQRYSVEPNEFNREEKYIENHIKATRFAFGLDQVLEPRLSGEARITREDIERNHGTINNIRLWNTGPLLANFRKRQELRQYYRFGAIDNGRYNIGGELRQLMLSARELPAEGLERRTWVNEALIYTHGYGIALSPVNQVNTDGQPVLFVQNLPPQESFPELKIDRPQIYYGESMTHDVFVRTNTPEFDYPTGDTEVTTTYEGKGGVKIGGLLRKLLFAIRLGSAKVLLTGEFTPETRILLYRDLVRRVQRVAPFLVYDRDPYLVIVDGRLIWIMDAYTRTYRFPYSNQVGNVGNYIRNSAKVVIDAYDGSLDFYLSDPDDPIIRAWSAAFEGMFKPIEEAPENLRRHFRYPADIFTVQTRLHATYHMQDAQIFYKQDDKWEVPSIDGRPMEPYYTVMKLPGETEEEFILMIPFTPKNRPNLAAWMVARSDGEHYGKLVAYTFPKDTSIYGPEMVIDRINQDVEISQQVSLWNQQGSEVEWGTLLVIPIEEALIYVYPLYLQAEGGGIPELKRVIVSYENRIAMHPTLEEALAELFGGEAFTRPPPDVVPSDRPPLPPLPDVPAGDDMSALTAQARRHFDAATQAARAGDWARYGQEIERLGEVLARLEGLGLRN